MEFRLSINLADLAARLNYSLDTIYARVKTELETLSISTHAFIVRKANEELTGYRRKLFFGENNKNIRWTKAGAAIWVVEIDPSVAWIEQGTPRRFMSWLLENNPKARVSNEGIKYAHIPIRHISGGKSLTTPMLTSLIRSTLKQERISLRKIEREPDGTPKLGVLYKLHMRPILSSFYTPSLFSKPRTTEEAQFTGLPPHRGIYLAKDLVILQRKTAKGKVVKEAVVFRTITEKHRGWRWMYPEIKGLHAIDAAYEWAQKEWETIIKDLEAELSRNA